MKKSDKIRVLAKRLGLFITKNLKVYDSRDKLTRVLLKHCKNEDELFEMLTTMSKGKFDINITDTQKEIEITERELASLYSKTWPPMDNQVRYFQIAKDREYFANFSEMGLGKTLATIMEAGYKYERGMIDSLVILAPNGVHRQWINQQIPEHLPDRFNPVTAIWSSQATKFEKYKLSHILLEKNDGLKVLSMNIEALGSSSDRAFDYLESFIDNNKCMLVIDESTRIKNPKAKRTKQVLKLKEKCKYRRILSGLYIPNGPLDLFSQFLFLDKSILGFSSYLSFKSRYAVETNPMLKRDLEIVIGNKVLAEKIYNERRHQYVTPARLMNLLGEENEGKFDQAWKTLKKSFLIVQGYKNTDELSDKIEKHSYRILKDQCLDLAPKTYMSYESTLSPEQKRIYEEVENELMTEINGGEIIINNILYKLMVLRQICGGTFKNVDGSHFIIEGKTPRLNLLIEILGDIDLTKNKVIIWGCYRAEIDMILNALSKIYGKEFCAQVHGDIKGAKREEEFRKFEEDEECRALVGTQSSGGIGRNLTAGNYMIFYSQNHDLEIRRQAEDREHRKGQTKNVTIIDLITKGLVDEVTLKALLSKQRLADLITKDPMCWKPDVEV